MARSLLPPSGLAAATLRRSMPDLRTTLPLGSSRRGSNGGDVLLLLSSLSLLSRSCSCSCCLLLLLPLPLPLLLLLATCGLLLLLVQLATSLYPPFAWCSCGGGIDCRRHPTASDIHCKGSASGKRSQRQQRRRWRWPWRGRAQEGQAPEAKAWCVPLRGPLRADQERASNSAAPPRALLPPRPTRVA